VQLCLLPRLAFVVSEPQDLNVFYWQFVLVRPCYGLDSSRFLTAEARVITRASPCEILVDKMALGQVILQVRRFYRQ
jgi:hypothetical protein